MATKERDALLAEIHENVEQLGPNGGLALHFFLEFLDAYHGEFTGELIDALGRAASRSILRY